MKKLLISSVVEFKLKDRVEDVLAQELFDISRNQGKRFAEETKRIDNLETSEIYLNRQMDRLRKYASEGQIKKFDYLASKLLKSSTVYLLYSLNHCFPNWHKMRMTKVIRILKQVRTYTSTEFSGINYRRVWIDKKPGDFERPLGVPDPADRIYGHMMTRIIEAYLCGTNQYSSMQHGGVPKRGTMTFLVELSKRLKVAKRVFEFDIKGYFDHIKHESMLELFKSEVILKFLKGALKSKPYGYELPSVEDDASLNPWRPTPVVAEKYVENMDFSGMGHLFDENYHLSKMLGQTYVQPKPPEPTIQIDFSKMEHLFDPYYHIKKMMPGFTLPHKGYMPYEESQTNLDGNDMFGNLPARMGSGIPSEKNRALGRDRRKDLDLENQGVPQGSSFGPVLASVVLGKVMPKNSLLYMDDGLIFLDNQNHPKDYMFNAVNARVKRIGCELAPDKTRTLRTLDLMTQGLKIVGTRWTQVRDIFNYSVSSETRKGMKKQLFPGIKDNYLQILLDLHNKGHITTSKYRMLRWYLEKDGSLHLVRESNLFEIAEKIGIFGAILSRAYSPTVSLEEMKEQIEYGIFKSELKLRRSQGSLGLAIYSAKKVLLEVTEEISEVKPTIFNCRSIANQILIRYLNNELPKRNLKVQGMRKPFNSKKVSRTTGASRKMQ